MEQTLMDAILFIIVIEKISTSSDLYEWFKGKNRHKLHSFIKRMVPMFWYSHDNPKEYLDELYCHSNIAKLFTCYV